MSSPAEHGAADAQYEPDPVFIHSRREALVILAVWATCLVWSVSYCYLNGYRLSPEEVTTVWGVPTWVAFGIAVPWLLADVFSVWFCFFFMQEDDLGEAHEGLDIEEEIAEMHRDEEKQTHE